MIADGRRGTASTGGVDRPLSLVMVVAALVLVIACVNIANMQLSRATTRQKEIAIRQALGASRRRVVRQLMVESLLLAWFGGMVGIVFAVWLGRGLSLVLAQLASIHIAPGLNSWVLLFALVITLVSGAVFGLAPSLQMARRNVAPALKDSVGSGRPSRRCWNLHHPLVVVQVAGAVVVMVCGGLCVRSVMGVHRIAGFDTSKLVTVSLDGWHSERADLRRFFEDLLERVKGMPSVASASLADSVPLSERGMMRTAVHVEGVTIPEDVSLNCVLGVVTPEHFQTLNVPFLAGRAFMVRDSAQHADVMIVNDTLARQFWPNQSPIGKRVTFRDGRVRQIVGVVKTIRMRSLREAFRPVMYWPLAQEPKMTPALIVRTTGRPEALIPTLKEQVASLGLREPVRIRTLTDMISGFLRRHYATTALLNVFSFAGLLLCITGIYGVMAYAVRRRTREIGIRIALGARPCHVVAPVLARGGRLALIGLGFGLAISLVAIRIMESQLPGLRRWDRYFLLGVQIWDPVTLVAIPLLVLLVAMLACYIRPDERRRSTRWWRCDTNRRNKWERCGRTLDLGHGCWRGTRALPPWCCWSLGSASGPIRPCSTPWTKSTCGPCR